MRIITRQEWGFKGWLNGVTPPRVASNLRRYMVGHNHGDRPSVNRGPGVPQLVDSIHKANKWAGIGYNFAIDVDGNIYEGRGWDLQGAHCPPMNVPGIGVYFALGRDDPPNDAMKAAFRWLMEQFRARYGLPPSLTVHKAHWNTDCPGRGITQWIMTGAIVPGNSQGVTPGKDEMNQEEHDALMRTRLLVDDIFEDIWHGTAQAVARLESNAAETRPLLSAMVAELASIGQKMDALTAAMTAVAARLNDE